MHWEILLAKKWELRWETHSAVQSAMNSALLKVPHWVSLSEREMKESSELMVEHAVLMVRMLQGATGSFLLSEH